MKIRVPLGIITAVMMILAVMVLPVSAATTPQTVETTANIASGGGSIPIVLCKWEADTSNSLEDGDPTHDTPGSQFLPPVTHNGNKTVKYYAVVWDDEDNGDVNVVSWDVWHPDDAWIPEDVRGTFKYQIMGSKMNKNPGITQFQRAWDRGLLTVAEGYDADTILTEFLEKGTALVWTGSADIHYHQPAGDYRVLANAIDKNNNWAVPLNNTFRYMPVVGFEIDFDTVNYGSVNINSHKWIAGNTVFSQGDGKPTIRNLGNTFLQVTINQDDMGLGESTNGWNVRWDARMGNDNQFTKVYWPGESVTLPNPLPLCNTEELDFSIEVFKGETGEKSGNMTIGATMYPLDLA